MQSLCSSDVLLDRLGRIAHEDHVKHYWWSRGVGLLIIMIFLMIFAWILLGYQAKTNGISNYFIKSVDIYFNESIVITSAAIN